MNTGKVIGLILVVAGVGICLLSALWVGVGYAAGNYTNLAAPVLGLGIAFILAAPLAGVGVFMFVKGRREAAEFAEVEKERKLLGMVQAQGQVRISDVALELDTSRDQVKAWVYDLVHKGLFAGYVNWDDGTLYSRDAAQLRGNKCPSCGGQVELVGKGMIECPYCGAEIFLTG
ncbi:MAG: zinc ribbon domain-containing protein [Chloroflexi bacterium]|nr:zinc ribbon domain-containing protein [Chloroflexota bacterium]